MDKPIYEKPYHQNDNYIKHFFFTLLFVYGLGVVYYIFSYSWNPAGIHGSNNNLTVSLSFLYIAVSFAAAFLCGYNKMKAVLHAYIFCAGIHLLPLPMIIYDRLVPGSMFNITINILQIPLIFFGAPIWAASEIFSIPNSDPSFPPRSVIYEFMAIYVVLIFALYFVGHAISKAKQKKSLK